MRQHENEAIAYALADLRWRTARHERQRLRRGCTCWQPAEWDHRTLGLIEEPIPPCWTDEGASDRGEDACETGWLAREMDPEVDEARRARDNAWRRFRRALSP